MKDVEDADKVGSIRDVGLLVGKLTRSVYQAVVV